MTRDGQDDSPKATWDIACEHYDLVFKLRPTQLPREGQAGILLRCPFCQEPHIYAATEIVNPNATSTSE